VRDLAALRREEERIAEGAEGKTRRARRKRKVGPPDRRVPGGLRLRRLRDGPTRRRPGGRAPVEPKPRRPNSSHPPRSPRHPLRVLRDSLFSSSPPSGRRNTRRGRTAPRESGPPPRLAPGAKVGVARDGEPGSRPGRNRFQQGRGRLRPEEEGGVERRGVTGVSRRGSGAPVRWIHMEQIPGYRPSFRRSRSPFIREGLRTPVTISGGGRADPRIRVGGRGRYPRGNGAWA
jgi:hypothetical protein